MRKLAWSIFAVIFLGACSQKRNANLDAAYIAYLEKRLPYDHLDYRRAYLEGLDWIDSNVHLRDEQLSPMGRKFKYYAKKLMFEKILSTPADKDDPYVQYYKAIAHYAFMRNKIEYNDKQREVSKGHAVRLFNKVINGSGYPHLKAKAKLWLGMTIRMSERTNEGKRDAFKMFQSIIDDHPKSDVRNDAILYAAQLSSSIGETQKAREYLALLKTAGEVDKIVWDPYRRKFLNHLESARLEENDLAKKM